MNLEGKIVFIAGAITGVAGYKKIFPAAEQWLLEQECIASILRYCRGGWNERYIYGLQRRWCAARMSSMSCKTGKI